MILLTVYKYRIYCNVDQEWEYVWDTTPPSVCPINSLHTVNANSVSYEDIIQVAKIDTSESPYKVKQNSVFCDTSSGDITLNLPKATRSTKLHYIIKKTASPNTVTITPFGSELIDNGAIKLLTGLNQTVMITSDGSGWITTSYYGSSTIENEFKPSTLVATRQKGDILIDSGTEMISLPLGTNNYVLLADSSQSVGIKWAPIDHTNLANIGTNTHAQIDAHISASAAHGVSESIVGTTETQTLSNKSLHANTVFVVDNTDETKKVGFEVSGATPNTNTIIATSQTANRIITLPDSTDTLIGKSTIDTLSNKSLQNNTVFHVDNIDVTKKIGFGSSGATTSTTTIISASQTANRTISLPDTTTTLVGTDTAQTLTNKTLTTPIIASISNTGTITLPTSTDVLIGRNTTDTLTNKSVIDETTYFINNADNTKKMRLDLSNVTASTTRTLTVPNATTTLVGTDVTQTLTNKTLIIPIISTISNTGTLTLPTSTDTLIGKATTDTLTNKTLTEPIISTISNIGTLTLPTSTDTLVGKATTDTLTNKTLTEPIISTISNTGIITLPTSTDTLVGKATTDTLTNKTLIDSSTVIADNMDNTKQIKFNVTGTTATSTTILSAQTADRILTLPDVTDTLVGKTTTDTLTNKTLTAPVISTISNTGTLTLPTSTDTLVGKATTDTLTNKTLIDSSTVIADNTDNTKQIKFNVTGTTATSTTILSAQTTDRTLTLPDVTDTLVGKTTTDVLTNKTLIDNSTIIANNSDNTKQLKFTAGGSTATATSIVTSQTNNRTITLPDITDTLVGKTTTDTLTNKTLTAPIISTISNTGTLTLPITTDTLVGRITTDTLTNKTLTAPVISTITNTGTLTLPTSTDTLVGRTTTDTLTNKTLTAPIISTISNTGILTLPQSTDTLVGRTTTDTLINKIWGDDLNMNSYKITNLAIPTANTDAANKGYVDSVVTGLDIKISVYVATTNDLNDNSSIAGSITYNPTGGSATRGQITATLAITNTFTVDNVIMSSTNNNARILVKDQSSGAQNGIWTITISGTSLILDRATDFDQDSEVTSGAFTFIENGIINGNSGWVLATSNPIIIGGASGTSLMFSQFSGTGQITAGNGLTKSGSVLDIGGSTTILINTDSVEVNSSVTANQVLLSNGTIGIPATYGALPLGDPNSITGTLPIAHGGTNATSYTTGNRLIATNSDNTTLVDTSLDPTTICTLTDIQTLTNKTLTTPIISTISNTGILTLPTNTDTLIGKTTVDTLTNKTLTDTSTYFADDLDATKKMQFQLSGITTNTTRTLTVPDASTTLVGIDVAQTLTNKTLTSPIISTISNTGTLTLPTTTDTLVGRTTTDTLTNKTLIDSSTIIADNTDNTKQIKFNVAGTTSTSTTILSSQTSDKTLTLPDATDTLVGKTTTDTLTNKTLVSPIISTISNTGTLTLPTSTDTLVGRTTTDTLTNKTLTTPVISTISNTGTLTLPTSTDTLIGRATTDTLTNKTIIDNSTHFANTTDNTKKMQFQLSGITTGTTRTLTIPNADTILVGTDTIQTLTNKTITTPIITAISNGGLITIPTSTDTLVARGTSDTLTNKTLIDASTIIANNSDNTKQIKFTAGGTTSTTTTIVTAQTANRSLALPDATDTLIGRTTTDTLTNKSLNNNSVSFVDNSDATKKVNFNSSSATTSTTTTIAAYQTINRIISLPDATTTLVGTDVTQTLTNKTMTLPIISSISNTGILTLPTSTDTLVGQETTNTLTNKSLVDNTTYFIDNADDTKKMQFELSNITTATTRTITVPDNDIILVGTTTTQTLTNKTLTSPIISSISNTGTITLPTITDTLIGKTTTDILTNKTLIDNSTIIADNTDNTKHIKFDVAGTTSTATTILSSQTANRTLTLPDITDTLVGLTATQTLTNKTLTSPIIASISNTGTLTLPISTDTLVGRNTTDTLTNKTLTAPIISTITNTGTITLPTTTDTLVGKVTTDTLSNKTLKNDTVFHVDPTDTTKKIGFNTSGATTATTVTITSNQTTSRTLTLPDANDTLVGKATTDTLTNKTLTTPVIATISNTGTLTLPSSTDTLIGRNTTDTLTNKTLIDTSTIIADNTDNTKQIKFDASGTTSTSTTITSAQTSNRIITLPDASTTLVGTDVTQTLTNKTLTTPIISSISNTGTLTLPTSTDTLVGKATTDILTNKTLIDTSTIIADSVDNTKQIKFDAAGTTATSTTLLSSQTANRILTLPNVTDTLVGKTTTDILTNKTLTAPVISTIVNTGTLTLPTSTDTLVGKATSDTLSNKSLQTNTVFYVDNTDASKKIGFISSLATASTTLTLSGIQTTNRTITFPDATTILVGTDVAQTLTNKTLTTPIISSISNTGTLTLPTITDTLVGKTTTDTLTNKTLIDASTIIADNADNTKQIKFDAAGTTATSTTILSSQTVSRILTLPDATDTLVGKATSDTLTNKTLTTPIISTIVNTGTLTLPTSTDTLIGRATTDTLSNKTVIDVSTYFANTTDNTKKMQFQLSGITTATTRTLIIPDANTTIVGTDITQTLTNKTLTTPIISTISNTGTLTLPTSTDTLIGRNTVDTLTNKTLIDASTIIADNSDNTKQIKFDVAGTTSTSVTITSSQTANRILTLPDITDTLVARATIDTLANKSLQNNTVFFIDNTDATKKVGFSSSGSTTSTTLTLATAQTTNRTLTLPDATDTLVGKATIDTLTNKTLTSPIISTISNTGTLTLPTSTDTLIGRATSDTLSNKTVIDASTYFANTSDATKRMQFQLSGITTATIRTITIPDASTILVGTDVSQTLTNKTLIAPIISSISNTGTLTLPQSTDTLVGRTTTDTLTNKTLIDTSTIIADNADNTKQIKFDAGGTTSTSVTLTSAQTANRVITLPDATDTLVGKATTDILSNKSLQTNSIFFVDNTDATKKVGVISSGATTSTTLTLASIQTTNRTLTLPDATDTLVGKATVDTLTNKTLTTPIISTISNTGTLTLPTSTDTLVGKATTDVFTNKTIIGSTNTIAASQLQTTGSDVVVSGAAPPTTGQTLVATSATTATWQNGQKWLIRDEKTVGTGGGSFTSGSWITRTLGTMTYNGGSNVTLSSNQFTLTAGTYRIKAQAVASNVGIHQTRIYDVSGSVDVSYGLVIRPSGTDSTPCEVECIVTPESSTTYRLEHRCTTTNTTNGLGAAAGWGTEVYANVLIEKF